jgi:hypothetical protein
MTWQKVSDDLWRHRKVGSIDSDKLLQCVGLWTLALAWTGANLNEFRSVGACDLSCPLVRPELP